MEIKYGIYEIKYDEDHETFKSEVDGASLSNPSLKKLKQKIDRITKPKFKKLSVFFVSHWSHNNNYFDKGFITSIAISGMYDDTIQKVWTVDSDKNRSKKRAVDCYLDTEDNKEKMALYNELKEKEKEFKEKAFGVLKSMETYHTRLRTLEREALRQ